MMRNCRLWNAGEAEGELDEGHDRRSGKVLGPVALSAMNSRIAHVATTLLYTPGAPSYVSSGI